jgi:uncharacterized membrane protein YcaP (DUF421 family)
MFTKETLFSLLRAAFTLIGSFLIGKHILGGVADSTTIELIIGIAMSAASLVWSVLDKTATVEVWQTVLRQIVTTIGGILIANGKLQPEKLEVYVGLLTALVPFLDSILNRKKTTAISNGTLLVSKLKQ